MHKIMWIGQRGTLPEIRSLCPLPDAEWLEFDNVETALSATRGVPVAVSILSADWGDPTPSIKKLARLRPETQILVASRLAVPTPIAAVLNTGARNVVDLEKPDTRIITKQVRDAVGRHRRVVQERELLLRLRGLNDAFLKNIVALEQRNIELERRLGVNTEQTDVGPLRILVVDDEPAILSMFEMMLEDTGFEVVTAADGEAALELFREKPSHLVITDKNLPGISGIALIKEVKQLQPDTDLILITGYASKDSAVEALRLGVQTYLEKPFDDINVVLEEVEHIARRRDERNKRRHYLNLIKQRNRDFLEQYRAIRTDLENWLQTYGGV